MYLCLFLCSDVVSLIWLCIFVSSFPSLLYYSWRSWATAFYHCTQCCHGIFVSISLSLVFYSYFFAHIMKGIGFNRMEVMTFSLFMNSNKNENRKMQWLKSLAKDIKKNIDQGTVHKIELYAYQKDFNATLLLCSLKLMWAFLCAPFKCHSRGRKTFKYLNSKRTMATSHLEHRFSILLAIAVSSISIHVIHSIFLGVA